MVVVFVGFVSFLLFLFFQVTGIFGGDTGDLVTAAYLGGVPHPPGYPLYTLAGWLLAKLPVSTVVWRLTLLSSLPHAATAALVYWLVRHITKRTIPAVFAALVLVGNYLFFLYSVTPEVFALFDLFVIALIVLLFQWEQTKDRQYIFVASFFFGLSLSHHHVILFLVPALVYFIYKVSPLRVSLKLSFYKVRPLKVLGCFLIGLLPYLYLPIAGAGASIINWNRPVDVFSFIRLVSRADYGTFVSSGFYGTLLPQRFVQLKAYGTFLLLDLTLIGIFFGVLGFWWLWRVKRKLFWFFMIALIFLGPLFFFYASFPLVNRFTLGTYERFLLPSYVLMSVIVGIGFWQSIEMVGIIARRLKSPNHMFWMGAVGVVLMLYPVTLAGVTLWRFWGIRSDRTAENLAIDILSSVPSEGILLLQRDTPLFTAQYMRYAVGSRPDVTVIHTSRLATADYPKVLARVFPQLALPKETGDTFAAELVKANRGQTRILTNVPFAVEQGWAWVPRGLVYEFMREKEAPAVTDLIRQNEQLWNRYHDPTAGILSRYDHLMLSDVRDVYAGARLEFGKTLLRAGEGAIARTQFEKAIALGGDTQISDAYTLLGLSHLFAKNCDSALAAFAKAREANMIVDHLLPLYESVTYRDCVGDAARAKELLDEYEQLQKKTETPLGR
ncbi:hypothetical protein A3A64_01360 [Candidatus Gottesmanbacteria bacterium RIFCSPLOWO2_01_FULL_48_11]|uniref:DUF2723 domain-containing protein n=3 Tax=Candidatus Gottesmaniibacteriota TaxID=1752720 RepID=A0A0G1UQ96_9BACT|nr:MAG: hypothetical protein UY16_C0015G0041 [Candidatus Gottesmanbacteria bacterium GW2011_GWA2_47_9]KKU96324.1 MAG: hypothetical protein UY27_C0001G0017 [Candidatus Gottesmanbacteria bacterium GW2011_GWA1_48_13]OGG28106.1 MAG: hypothetical protein A3A64_01360 [Candidatus Gottesmanbacteria bacterium RIFCSPLOWO2_01_FULL_48_11]